MNCQRAIGKLAEQVVNNFAANRAARVSDWPLGFIFGIGSHWFSRTGGPGLLTSSRLDDFELMDRPVGRGLTL
jgi:hypothetical protein